MLRVISALLLVATASYASQIGVLHTPSYVQLTTDPIAVSLSEVQSHLQHLMGFTVTSGAYMPTPMAHTGLFRRPKAVVAIEIDGLDYVPVDTVRSFELLQDSDDADLTNLFTSVRRVFGNDGSLLVDYDGTVSVDVALGSDPAPDVLPQDVQADAAVVLQDAELTASRSGATWSLKPTEPLDAAFLVEMRRLLTMCARIRSLGLRTTDGVPDVFAFRIRAYAALVNYYGSYSLQAQDAVSIMSFLIRKMDKVFREVYELNVMVVVLGLEDSSALHYRVKRQASAEPTATSEPPAINLAPAYTQDYPAFFNIILWLVVGLAITILLISWVLWTMDPGDSIIYRMVQLPRIKKDL